MRRAVFLDRDGVINRSIVRNGKAFPPDSLAEFEILPGVPEAIAALKAQGFLIVVVTNQPDVATGKQDQRVVEEMHAQLRRLLPIDDLRVCYHVDADACGCRKPEPGMLLAAAESLGIDLAASYMVGDRWRDIEAGQRAGCRTFFIDYGYDERAPSPPFVAVNTLAEAAARILADPDAPAPHRS